jgi:hypothetical protein
VDIFAFIVLALSGPSPPIIAASGNNVNPGDRIEVLPVKGCLPAAANMLWLPQPKPITEDRLP